MTPDERDRRWQEIFDNYDKAIAEFHAQLTLTESVAPLFHQVVSGVNQLVSHLDQLAAKWDTQAAAARKIADATMAANRAALALYREEEHG